MSSPTPHRFDDPIWPIRDALGWLIDRDPTQFGRLLTNEDARVALHYREGVMRENARETTILLHALQRGELIAYAGINPVSRDFWTDKTPRYIRATTGFLFRREDVLVLWPDPCALISRAPHAITPLRGGHGEPAEAKSKAVPRGRGGRRKGSGEKDDTAALTEMLRWLAAGKANTA